MASECLPRRLAADLMDPVWFATERKERKESYIQEVSFFLSFFLPSLAEATSLNLIKKKSLKKRKEEED